MALNLTEQAFILSKFEILPRRLRAFYHFIFYTYVNYNRNNTSLFKKMISYKKKSQIVLFRYYTRRLFNQPLFLTNLYNYSYLSISIRILNFFLFGFLNLRRSSFMNKFRYPNFLINFYNFYLKERDNWE